MKILYTAEQVQQAVCRLAGEIERHFGTDEDVTVLALLNGALWFAADVLRALPPNFLLETARVSSYGDARSSSGTLQWKTPMPDVRGKRVLIVDDVLDTGFTLQQVGTALREAAQFYVQLHAMGFPIEFVDCGGGLGVDYDGTRSSNSESSVNYSIQEYVNDCVYTLVEAANQNNIPHPNIITEGGRSLTAHHSVLIVDVLESVTAPQMPEDFQPGPEDHKLVHDLTEIWDKLSSRSLLEDWHDAEDIREEALDLFRHGIIDLKTRAQIESLYWAISHEVAELAHHLKHAPDELRKLDKQMADKYFCNFSLFQSMPDSWGIDQLFPIMPIARLGEQPTRSATLQDITCDSDGKISAYVNGGQQTNYIPLHPVKHDEHYYIGVFLVGAYQEILGNMHNLFGDTNAVHISVDKEGYTIDQVIDGETVADVLDYVQYDPKKLVRRLEIWVSKAVKDGKITESEGKEFISNYRAGLYGYTYLE